MAGTSGSSASAGSPPTSAWSTAFRFAGANIEGKAHAINVYFGGVNNYLAACAAVEADGYRGFAFSS